MRKLKRNHKAYASIILSSSSSSSSSGNNSSSIELYWHDIKIFYILPKRFKFSLVQITLIVLYIFSNSNKNNKTKI